jgi:toxin ParE1/3/4
MDCDIVWTDRASIDLRRVFDYISEQNPTAADEAIQAILDRVELLMTSPRMGRHYTTRNEQEVRQVVSGKYRIFYAVVPAENRVEILTVWHGARQEPDLSE